MRTLALTALALSAAFIPSAALAQTVAEPGWEGVPVARMRGVPAPVVQAPPRVIVAPAPAPHRPMATRPMPARPAPTHSMPGHSMQGHAAPRHSTPTQPHRPMAGNPAPVPPRAPMQGHAPVRGGHPQGHQPQGHPPMPHVMPGRAMHSGATGHVRGGSQREVRRHAVPGQQRGGHRFSQIRRIDRGGIVPQHWWGPRYQVRDWRRYGFAQPMQGGRWVRYYDDALLIDSYGRVLDGRYGLDWDRYGDSWGYDDDGVPAYLDGDYREDDYAYEEEGDYYEEERGHYPAPLPRVAQPAYGYGYAYGYVPMLVTETITTTTTAPVMEERTYYEYEKVKAPRRAVRRPVRRAAPACDCPTPAQVLGEKG